LPASRPLPARRALICLTAGTAVLVSPGSTLKSGADLKGKRIATGKGSIGHFVALKALEQAGISPARRIPVTIMPYWRH
ncbi:ABC transporter substrate-binding protein, partial [Acinetobacter pittii]|uniref:ABC transporter substrate-binding protein n=1 Tax=Acinetobacter pittii TaxID=48296 RepID=UPI00227C1581